jgi:hypothetical protein
MKAIDFVLSKYPKAYSHSMIDNRRGRNSYVILKGVGSLEIFPNEGANTASKAWTNAKKHIQSEENKPQQN